MPLERTQMGNPFTGVSPKKTKALQNNTLSALGNMAALTSGIAQTIADSQEDKAVMDAQNDLVNDTINPDKEMHKAAYAWTIAEGEALQGYNDTKTRIEAGEFNELDPEDFQREMSNQHSEYYKKWEDNPHAGGAINAYNKFMLKNQSSLSAAQAGKWRIDQVDKQTQAMAIRITEMANSGLNTVEDYEAEMEDPKYSLLDARLRLKTVLTGAGKQAATSGHTDLLEALDDKYGFSGDVELSGTFNGHMKAANRVKFGHAEQSVYEMRTFVDDLVDEGVLTDNMYSLYREVRDTKGKALYTPSQFRTMVEKAKVNRAKKNVQAGYKVALRSGNDMSSAKKATFEDSVDSLFAEEMQNAGGDPEIAIENMGRYLADQTHTWDRMKNRANLFERQPMMLDNKPNKKAMGQYYELAALERGMNARTNGTKVFSRYLGGSLATYLTIKSGLELTKDAEGGAWASVAASLEVQKDEAKKIRDIADASTPAKEVGAAVATQALDLRGNPLIPNFIEDIYMPDDPSSRIAIVGAKAYDKAIAEGASDSVATEVAIKTVDRQVYKWGGELYDFQGKDPKVVFGTTDPEGAWKTLIQDPEWGEKLTDFFGVYWKGAEFLNISDIEVDAPGWFTGEKRPETEAEIREAEKLASDLREKGRVFLDPTRIDKTVNMETGMLDFKARDFRGEIQTFSIPLLDIGAAHNSVLQDTEEIDRLDRLYDGEFLQTKEGRAWHDHQADLNDKFATEILDTDKSDGRGVVPLQEYVGMPQVEQTRVRKQFYEDNYTGVKGRLSQLFDFFNLKREAGASEPVTIFKKAMNEPIPDIESVDTTPDKVIIGKGAAVKNNNPGNLRFYNQTDSVKGSSGFAKFKTPEAGFKALEWQITLDQNRGDTIRTFLEVYAPPSENDTEAYIKYLATELGVSEGTKLNSIDTTKVAKAVAKYESGTTFK